MVAEILKLTECIDNDKRFQSRGDKAIYYLKVQDLNSIKFNADCIKVKLNIDHRIGDSFFYVWSGGGAQKRSIS